jgi:Cu+-exporting ATPase
MNVDEKHPAGTSTHAGRTYYFCSYDCKVDFDKDPSKYVK